VAEDVGRHNTLDKLRGMALMEGLDTRDLILLSSGRISSEMLVKAAKMKVPVIVSRTSPTSLSVALAQAWGFTLIGYARQSRMNVYAGEERLGVEA
jgi:FdhD protein